VSVVHCQWRTRRQHLRSEYGYGLGSGAFAMKAMRMEPETGRALLKDRLWNRGLRSAMRALREGNESGAIGDTLRFAGCVVGAVSARRLRVSDGRFVG